MITNNKVEHIEDEVFDAEHGRVGDDPSGGGIDAPANKMSDSTTQIVTSKQNELEDLQMKFDTMSQIIRKELEHFDFVMNEEFQAAFSAYNSNYFNLIDRSRAPTSLSVAMPENESRLI